MQFYPQQADEILEKLMAFMESCTQLKRYKKACTTHSIKQLIQTLWADFSIDFLPNASQFNLDKDCLLSRHTLPQQVFNVYKKTAFDSPTDQEILQDIQAKYFFLQTAPLPHTQDVCLMAPRSQAQQNMSHQRFFVSNACIRYTKPTHLTLESFLKDEQLRNILYDLSGALLDAKEKNPNISEETFLEAAQKATFEYASGAKQTNFINLVEKTRQSLFDILVDKNEKSSHPIPNLRQQFLQRDKTPIYRMAASKNLIPSAQHLIECQAARDWLIHPDEAPYQEMPSEEEIITNFQTIANRLRGKSQKVVQLLVDNSASESDIQKLTQRVAQEYVIKNGRHPEVKQVYVGDNQNLMNLTIANEQTSLVNSVKKLVSELTPPTDATGKKIKKEKQLDYLAEQQIIDQTQRQELGHAITTRNHLSHAQNSKADAADMANPINQEKLRNNAFSLLKNLMNQGNSHSN